VQVKLHTSLHDSVLARDAAEALEACVHCGFCLATCPTYLDTRDERDSPRGRLYLLQELLEDGEGSAIARTHLDRCLTCRACETTCPSGVQYGHIADAGRELLEERHPRPLGNALLRGALRLVVPRPKLFRSLLRLGQGVRPFLPRGLRSHIPPRQVALAPLTPAPQRADHQAGRVLLLEGCVQSSATPRTNAALRRILARLGIEVIESSGQGCCGALNTHLAASARGRADMRRNIDAWWPAIEEGKVDAILVSASGCAAQVQDYGHALAGDTAYSGRARTVAALLRDPAAFLGDGALDALPSTTAPKPRVAVHVPCTQQHALPHGDAVRSLLSSLGFPLCPTTDDHLCCGSAGTYSILQPAMSERLRDRKRAALRGGQPEVIVTANVGCQLHLQDDDEGPAICHWLELVDAHLA